MRFTIRDLLWLTLVAAAFCAGTQLDRYLKQPRADPQEAKIYAALDQPADIQFVETPLKDAIDFVADQHGIPIVLDAKRLEEAGVNIDTPVTKNLRGLTLRSTLNLLLSELELTYAIQNGVLMITTDAEAQRLQSKPFGLQATVWLGVAVAFIWGVFLCSWIWRRVAAPSPREEPSKGIANPAVVKRN
jgi:type II secretory pathway component GspD/PulD (secretin)